LLIGQILHLIFPTDNFYNFFSTHDILGRNIMDEDKSLSQPPASALPPSDKKIPTSVMLIGSFEVATALLGLVVVMLVGQFDAPTFIAVVLLVVYGAMGAGLLAIQEWARFANVVLHMIAVPYGLYTATFLGAPSGWQLTVQIVIAVAIVFALSRPTIRHKFKTVVPKKKRH
jgi:hypothetical protein